MGCSLFRESLHEEEDFIQRQELLLPFCRHNSTDIDLQIRKVASKTQMLPNQFREILTKYSAASDSAKDHLIEAYFNVLLRNKATFDRKKLLLSAVMYGLGTPAERVQLLYEIEDTELSKFIPIDAGQLLAAEMVNISMDAIVVLIEGKSGATRRKNVENYLHKLDNVRSELVQEVVNALFRDTKQGCSLALALKSVRTAENASLLTTKGIRNRAAVLYTEKRKTALKKSHAMSSLVKNSTFSSL